MTATTAVPSFRLARLAPYLLAVGLAILAWLLFGSHVAFAEEKSGPVPPKHHVAETVEQAPHHAHPIAPKETDGAPHVQAVHVGQSPTSFAPPGHPHSGSNSVGHPAEAEGPAPVNAAPPPPAPVRPVYAAPQQVVPIAPAQPRHVEQRAWTSQPPVQAVVAETAPPAPHRPADVEEPAPVQAAPPPPPVRPAAAPAVAPATGFQTARVEPTHAQAPVLSIAAQHPVLAASVQRWAPVDEKSSAEDKAETARSFSLPAAKKIISPRPATSHPAAHGTISPRPAASHPAAHKPATANACPPPAQVSFPAGMSARSEAPVQSQPETGAPVPEASAPPELPAAMLATLPLMPAAPAPEAIAPVAAAAPPASSSVPPVATPVPLPGLAVPSRDEVLGGSPLVARLQSALTLIALALLLPLLAIVLLVQMRLMRLIRSLQAASEANEPAKRYYSLSHEEVRELAPDLVAALAHHRFCESERHQGRHRVASWLELEQASTELPQMWATCETCHHQRITKLQTGREVATAHN
jgi:hypothetical protein